MDWALSLVKIMQKHAMSASAIALTRNSKNYFRPEFLNRLDEVIVFRQLTKDEVKQIAVILLKEISQRLNQERDMTLTVTEAFKERVVSEGYDPQYGARPLRRAIMSLLEDSLAEAILSGRVNDGDSVVVDVDERGNVHVLAKQAALMQSVR